MKKNLQNKDLSQAMARGYAKLSRREQLRQAEAEIYRRFAVFRHFRPLMHGVHEPLCEALPYFEADILQRVLQLHCARLRYLKAIRQGGARFDLQNRPCGEILPEEQDDARRKIEYADRQREQANFAVEDNQNAVESEKIAAENEKNALENAALLRDALAENAKNWQDKPTPQVSLKLEISDDLDHITQLIWDDAPEVETEHAAPETLSPHNFSAQRAIWDDATIAENSMVYADFLKENIRESVNTQSETASLAHSADLLFQFVPETLAQVDIENCPPENHDAQTQAHVVDHFIAAESLDLPANTDKFAENLPDSVNVAENILEIQDLDLRPILSDAPEVVWQKSSPKSPRLPQLVRVGERVLSAKALSNRRDSRLLVAEKLREIVHDLGGVAPAGQKIVRDETRFPAKFAPPRYASRLPLRKTKMAAKRYAAIIKIPPVGIK